jgi:hypothetical protein
MDISHEVQIFNDGPCLRNTTKFESSSSCKVGNMPDLQETKCKLAHQLEILFPFRNPVAGS